MALGSPSAFKAIGFEVNGTLLDFCVRFGNVKFQVFLSNARFSDEQSRTRFGAGLYRITVCAGSKLSHAAVPLRATVPRMILLRGDRRYKVVTRPKFDHSNNPIHCFSFDKLKKEWLQKLRGGDQTKPSPTSLSLDS
jgi:hypothetical protein